MQNISLINKLEATASKKIELIETSPLKYLGRAILAGALLTFATAIGFLVSEQIQRFLLVILETSPEAASIAYNISKIFFSMIFPWALVLILFMNTELFTSNVMYFSGMILAKKVKVSSAIKVLICCYIGNFIGAVLTSALIVYSNTFTGEVAHFAQHVVDAKLDKIPHIILLQGIIANIIVNVAVILNFNLKDDSAKIKAILFAIFIFAFFGSEHVIANFSSFSLVGFATNFADITIANIAKNFFFSTLGNLLGGAIIGVTYAWFNIGNFKYKD